MKDFFEILKDYLSKPTLLGLLALVLAVVLLIFCSSCSTINRSSASGHRQVEKTIRNEIYWDVPSENGAISPRSQILTSRYVRQRT